MATAEKLLAILADGRFHSGEDLGASLQLSRSAVWKALQVLKGWGVELHAVRGRGYRLARPLDLLNAAEIEAELAPANRQKLVGLDVLPHVDSSNRKLRESGRRSDGGTAVLLAEGQSAGRGRRGRTWVSPFAGNLYCSVMMPISASLEAIGGLSLAVGVALCQALETLGFHGIGLKWPNDVYWQGKKLAGVLIEIEGESGGPGRVIIGFGLNVTMTATAAADIDQPWTDLQQIARTQGLVMPGRSRLAGVVLDELLEVMDLFDRHGFKGVVKAWQRLDVSRGRPVRVVTASATIEGEGLGVDDSGAFLLRTDGEVVAFHSADVSLRL